MSQRRLTRRVRSGTPSHRRSRPAIRAALAEHGASGELERFEDEMRAALIRAAADLDLTVVDAVLGRWHELARWPPTHSPMMNKPSSPARRPAT